MFNGWTFYRGPSVIDSSPILGIVSSVVTPSENIATGPMVQTYIIREDVSPTVAIRSGKDYSVCGDCKLRNRVCYVLPWHGPGVIWREYHKGNYPLLNKPGEVLTLLAAQRHLRIGSYGDPAAIPIESWWRLMTYFPRGHTGYTHQWKHPWGHSFRGILQASCDTPEDYVLAKTMG